MIGDRGQVSQSNISRGYLDGKRLFLRSDVHIVRPHSCCSKGRSARASTPTRGRREGAITSYLPIHDERPKPFVWTKMAAEIFASVETDLVDVSQIHETRFYFDRDLGASPGQSFVASCLRPHGGVRSCWR